MYFMVYDLYLRLLTVMELSASEVQDFCCIVSRPATGESYSIGSKGKMVSWMESGCLSVKDPNRPDHEFHLPVGAQADFVHKLLSFATEPHVSRCVSGRLHRELILF